MCGITGFLDGSLPGADGILDEMTDSLAHRGPDSRGTWSDARAGVWLGHRRLAIIDLSQHGHQPMVSHDGRWVLTFNGEIYNFPDLRASLESQGARFRGSSDTEVLLEAVARWGLEQSLARAHGQFAFALWDRETGRLHLARDRLGEKPLYYGWMGTTFLFASELKAMGHHPSFRPEVDPAALGEFLRYGHVPAPLSIWRGIRKLPPGHRVTIRPGQDRPLDGPTPYWSLLDVATEAATRRFSDSGKAVDELEAVLRRAVRRTMVADVPLGVFLSGGLDSSTVTALMRAEGDRPVRSFTIGFEDATHDEAEAARRVAEHLGTQHTEFTATAKEAQAVIPLLPTLYDEPFADSSQIPTHLVSRMARKHVTVALSGDGGDEVFGGYNRYVQGAAWWERLRWTPRALRAAAGGTLIRLPAAWKGGLARFSTRPGEVREGTQAEKVEKIAGALGARNLAAFHDSLRSLWQKPPLAHPVPGARPTPGNDADGNGTWSTEERMMLRDSVTYLPDDILVKVDRASLGVGLEVRAPFLDPSVVEFAWRLPPSLRVRGRQGKWALRQVLYRHVPPALVERPKTGFAVPLGSWLRGPLREWAESLLEPARLRQEGFLAAEPIRKAWQDHLAGRRERHHLLWAVLMFQSWLESQRPALTRPLVSPSRLTHVP